MDLIVDSLLVFGRCSLGATIGLIFGTLTQGGKHARWSIGWFVAGYAVGAATLWPDTARVIAAAILLVPAPLWAALGLVAGAATLGNKEDWYLRMWGWLGFMVGFHLTAIGAMAVVDAVSD